MKSHRLVAFAALPWLLLLPACPPDGDEPNIAAILDPTHLGWKSQDCLSCKELPRPDHNTTEPPDCVSCHGANGACDTTSPGAARNCEQHEDCISCHGENHSFTQLEDCTSCHYATDGMDDCSPVAPDAGAVDSGPVDATLPDTALPDLQGVDTAAMDLARPDTAGGGPQLSTALVDNCFDWPAQPFGSGASAQVETFLHEGETAVELTLSDVNGDSSTLSSLLASRPVLLVFGAFT